MWLMIPCGFYSVVEKDKDKQDGMLTVRARVKSDLDALRQFLPQMGKIVESADSDYRYRFRAHKVDFAYALLKIAMTINYGNFKNKVLETQGIARADTYLGVWSKLRDLQLPSTTGNF